MSNTISYVLVRQTSIDGKENTEVAAAISAEYRTGYRCEYHDETYTEDQIDSGNIYRCQGCDDYVEVGVGDGPDVCCYHQIEDEDGNEEDDLDDPYEFDRIDGVENNSVEGKTCPQGGHYGYRSESHGEVQEVEILVCTECEETLIDDDNEVNEHLLEHIKEKAA